MVDPRNHEGAACHQAACRISLCIAFSGRLPVMVRLAMSASQVQVCRLCALRGAGRSYPARLWLGRSLASARARIGDHLSSRAARMSQRLSALAAAVLTSTVAPAQFFSMLTTASRISFSSPSLQPRQVRTTVPVLSIRNV